MFFPIGDAPNPRDFRAWVTWAIIVANVVVYVVLTLPMSTQAASPQDPRIPEYVEMLHQSGFDPQTLRHALGQLSVYDLFVFEHGFRPADPSIADLTSWEAVGISIALLVAAWVIYDVLCRLFLPRGRNGTIALWVLIVAASNLVSVVSA